MSPRRDFLKKAALLLGTSATTPFEAIYPITRNSHPLPEEAVIGHGDYQYKVDKAWGKISPNTTPLFNCHEMIQDSSGRLIMLGDHTHNNILIFDKSGKLLDSWGNAFPGGHGLSLGLDDAGDDFLLITDCGWYQDRTGKWGKQQGQVVQTTTDGKIRMTIGHPKTIGIYPPDAPFMPTETAVAPNGDIYVADGYGSDYIIQYDQQGRYIRHFGGHQNSDKEYNLHNAHGVTVDLRDPSSPKLICTSRAENCFKVFSLDGKFLERIDLPGMHVCRAVIKGNTLYAGVCWSKDKAGNTDYGDSGFVTILNAQNKVVSNPGGMPPRYEHGKLLPTLQDKNGTFQHGHDVCVDDEENLYICQWKANYTPPVKLTRI
ncbi:peptidylglycine monooxygenase [Dyadobacter tibetensis]|uniref:peptidylglycine monooxygenase n=1 Tax=Dyadobacter tibetensis TaxID=1211851 RepID=UPI00047149CC|nr:peptidylglycine monooxygenase [Dyadobacter tibetensis]